jgi:hypothetical protein
LASDRLPRVDKALTSQLSPKTGCGEIRSHETLIATVMVEEEPLTGLFFSLHESSDARTRMAPLWKTVWWIMGMCFARSWRPSASIPSAIFMCRAAIIP